MQSGVTTLVRTVAEEKTIRRLRAALCAGRTASIEGVWGGSVALLAAAMAAEEASANGESGGTLVLVAAQRTDARRILDDLRLFTDDGRLFANTAERPVAAWFPPWDRIPDFGSGTITDPISGERLQVLRSLGSSNPPRILVAPLQSLLQPIPDPSVLATATLTLSVGDTLEPGSLLTRLTQNGFVVQPAVELPHEVAMRGGLLDLFAPNLPLPLRIEFFDDMIESIRFFAPTSQRSTRTLENVEILTTSMTSRCGRFRDFLSPMSRFLLVEPAQLRAMATTLSDSGGTAEPAEAMTGMSAEPKAKPTGKRGRKRGTESDEKQAVEPVSAIHELFREAAAMGTLMVEHLAEGAMPDHARWRIESVERFSRPSMEAICGVIGECAVGNAGTNDDNDHAKTDSGDTIVIVSSTTAEIERLHEIFTEQTPQIIASGQLRFVHGSLSAGFRIPELRTIFLSSTKLFQRSDRHVSERAIFTRTAAEDTSVDAFSTVDGPGNKDTAPLSRVIDSFAELRPGDLVVHVSQGIARYHGLHAHELGGRTEEFLLLEFADRCRVWIPASQIGLIQKYLGGAKGRPPLSKYNGAAWARKKKLVADAVGDLAVEMLEMAAARDSQPGIAFPADGPWQHDFDEAFPYVETDDQLTAATAIRDDMRRARPMDRLLCGDVGFGKTELAMRAAMRAILAGYQVAVLVPTTVLAEQHYRTFRERMAAYPVRIAMLSRFVDTAGQRRTLRDLEAGDVDLVIGTHRLASEEVRFRNAGLIIIDEEQRFGVEVKERLKRLRATADILTLTATPIPRTLHQAVLGIRDISSLQTPPEARLAVDTSVQRFDESLIREAILRELARGGQVYFVHNRVKDIGQVETKLRRIAPEARIGIGHAQMPADRLEQVMVDFLAHRYDILLATTIIESGLDIPTTNTIFIDEAHRYGLADLHQLRGRVGRGREKAYCYLLVDRGQSLTPNATRRLRTLEEYSRLGAGFEIAMRDLEIRGAGNLLGTQQSGHIAAVGYEMYCELLEQAIGRLQKQPPRKLFECEVNLPWRTYIPEEYVPGMRDRIDLYRRLARVTASEQLAAMRDEFSDRFGVLPIEVSTMLRMVELRLRAARHLITRISWETPNLRIAYLSEAAIRELNKRCGGRLRTTDPGLAFFVPPKNPLQIRENREQNDPQKKSLMSAAIKMADEFFTLLAD